MKRLLYIPLLLFCGMLNAQTTDSLTNKKMSEAWQYLNGYLKPLNPAKAFELYMQCAEQGNPKAMNAIGMQYNQGLGVDTNKTEAFKWFEKASQAGYPQGWYNLGNMYKYARGVEQDMVKAYDCFKKSSDLGYPAGWFMEGYMLYKGLGCQQDYQKAFTLFAKGVKKGRSSCMYFLGLCYRNGYGTTTNTDSARYWLSKASENGNHDAADELAALQPENNTPALSSSKLKSAKVNTNAQIAPIYKRVKHQGKQTSMDGDYAGYVIKYDWSGQHAIRQSKLRLNFDLRDSLNTTGQWVEDDTITVGFQAMLTDSALVFTQAQYRRTDHYHRQNPVVWQFKNARLEFVKNGDSVYLAGNLQLYSPKSKEPGKPLYISLTKLTSPDKKLKTEQVAENNAKSSIGNDKEKLLAYPNPFSNSLNIEFTLTDESEISIELLDLNGAIVYKGTPAKLQAGKQSLNLQLTIPVGSYIVKLLNGDTFKTTMVVKQ